MPFFSNLEEEDKVANAFMKFNVGFERPLLDLQQVILRSEDSPLSVCERELIAAFVSATNHCKYCRGAHTAAAIEFGAKPGLVESLLEDIDSADVEEKLKPILRYVQKLTVDLEHMEQSDADAVFDTGWSERALYDAIAVCCAFNYMNRFVNGLGLGAIPEQFAQEGKLLKQMGYDVADILKLK